MLIFCHCVHKGMVFAPFIVYMHARIIMHCPICAFLFSLTEMEFARSLSKLAATTRPVLREEVRMIYCQLRVRRALSMLVIDVALRTTRVLSLYKVYGDSTFLDLNRTLVKTVNAFLALSPHYVKLLIKLNSSKLTFCVPSTCRFVKAHSNYEHKQFNRDEIHGATTFALF